ncbi:MAG: hypothetical protein ABSE82_11120 [Nitrososphaerales archaeon]
MAIYLIIMFVVSGRLCRSLRLKVGSFIIGEMIVFIPTINTSGVFTLHWLPISEGLPEVAL